MGNITLKSLLAGSIGGLLVMVVKTWYDARSAQQQDRRQLRSMLTLIAVEVHLNRQALSLFTISATAGAEHFREHLRVQAWKDMRVRIAELMDNVDHYDKIAVYYEDVEWANDLIYRSRLPQTHPHEVSVDFWALLSLSDEVSDILKEYTNIEPSPTRFRR